MKWFGAGQAAGSVFTDGFADGNAALRQWPCFYMGKGLLYMPYMAYGAYGEKGKDLQTMQYGLAGCI